VKITIKDLQKKVSIRPIRIKKAILRVLASEGRGKAGDITVCFVNNKEIKRLNAEFHAKDEPTDVLAFDLNAPGEKTKISADIAISADAAVENSSIFGTTVDRELELYAIHGILHLLGYDDRTAKKRAVMQRKECLYIKPKR
jgi:probable rRNA maturation factor